MMNPAEVLDDLCRTVEATGGVFITADGCYAPVGDWDWIDIGQVYADACGGLGRLPMVVEDPTLSKER